MTEYKSIVSRIFDDVEQKLDREKQVLDTQKQVTDYIQTSQDTKFVKDFLVEAEKETINPFYETAKRQKFCHIGAPKVFLLEMAMRDVNEAFGQHASYVVGSCLERPDWRDVDIRMIMQDDEFKREFPNAYLDGRYEFDTRWLVLNTAISKMLSDRTDLPIDFQIHPATHANKTKGPRNAVGMRLVGEHGND